MFAPSQLHAMRLAYGGIQDIAPYSPTLEKLKATVRCMPPEALEQVVEADIRWLSGAAYAALRGRLDGPLPVTGGPVQDQGRGYLVKEESDA